MRWPLLTPILLGLVVASSIAGQAPDPLRTLFPVAATGAFEAAPASSPLHLAGLPPIDLHAVRFEPPEGRPIFRGVRWCGVVLAAPGMPAQAVITIGQGQTEVEDCNRLIEFGVLPAGASGARLGFVYQTSSPNATGRTLVVLVRDEVTGQWSTDEGLANAIGDRVEPMSLSGARRWLTQRGG